MTTSKHLKSILKKSSHPVTTSEVDRNREIAVYHANVIQQRKEFELEILYSTETLIDYPLASSPYDASNPSPVDSKNFKNLIQPFQPSDYDALILERNINERCGYALCSNKRKTGCPGKYRLIGKNGRAKDFRVVENKNLEKWCSDACAKRALYIRIQLNEVPIWERLATNSRLQIDLLPEPTDLEVQNSPAGLKLKASGDDPSATSPEANMHLCEKPAVNGTQEINFYSKSVPDLKLFEKEITDSPLAPFIEDCPSSNSHLQLEGHTTGDNLKLLGIDMDKLTL